MRSGQFNLLLLGCIAVLAAVLVWLEKAHDAGGVSQTRSSRLLPLSPDEIRYLRIESEDRIIELERSVDGWMVVLPFRDRADDGIILRLLEGWYATEIDVLAGEQATQDVELFGLTEPRVRVICGDGVDQESFTIGRTLPIGGGAYVNIEGDQKFYIAEEDPQSLVPATLHAFRQRTLIAGSPDQVKRFELRGPGGSVQCVRDESGGWIILEPYSGRGASVSIQDYLETLFQAQVEQFVADQVSDPGIYAIDERSPEIRVYLRDAVEPEVIKLGGAVTGSNLVYAADSSRSSVFAVSQIMVDLLSADVTLFRDHRPVPFTPEKISGVRVLHKNFETRLARTVSNAWTVANRGIHAAAPARVKSLLDLWTAPVVQTFLDRDEAAVTYADIKPIAVLEFDGQISESGPPQLWTLRIFKGPSSSEYVGQVVNENSWVTLPSVLLAEKSVQPLSFYSLNMLSVPAVAITGFTLESRAVTQTVALADSGAFTSESGKVNASHLQDLQKAFDPLVAKAVVGDSAEMLPEDFFSGEVDRLIVGVSGSVGISRTLLLGGVTPSGSRFAKVLGDSVVYLVSEATAAHITSPIVLGVEGLDGGK